MALWWLLACVQPWEETVESFASTEVGDSFDLITWVPEEPAQGVLVFQDGDYLPQVATAYSRWLSEGGTPVVVVGVAYQGGTTGLDGSLSEETMERRARDFTPREVEGWPSSGNARAFQDFLAVELIPELERRHGPLSPWTFGYSAFGLSVTYGLLVQSETFAGHCAGSASLATDDEIIFSIEEQVTDGPAGRAVFTVGDAEDDVPVIEAFVDQLGSRGWPELTVTIEGFDDRTHADSLVPGFRACLEAVEAAG